LNSNIVVRDVLFREGKSLSNHFSNLCVLNVDVTGSWDAIED